MMRFALFLTALTACATGTDPQTNSADQSVVTPNTSGYCNDGLGPIHCDGYTQDEGDFFCFNSCQSHGYEGGWCRHLNSNDAFHGLCASGWAP